MLINKIRMYDALNAGRLGNVLESHVGERDARWCGIFDATWGCRTTTVGHPLRLYTVPPSETEWALEQIRLSGVNPQTDVIFYPNPPMEFMTIQGELRETGDCGLEFYYSFTQIPQRSALERAGQTARGFEAHALVTAYCHPSTKDWLFELLDRYPGHTVEFAAFNCRLGIFNEYHLIWEVRAY